MYLFFHFYALMDEAKIIFIFINEQSIQIIQIMNSIGHIKNQKYNEFKSLLERAKSFNHLIFYNRKLISQYTIASYGFRMAKARDGHQEARCFDCGLGFRLDPLIQIQSMQLKESINQVLMNHEDQCKFNYRKRNFREIMKLNKQSIVEFGVLLYLQTISTNNYHLSTIEQFKNEQQQLESLLNAKFLKLFEDFTKNDKNIKFPILISLLGWTITSAKNLKCQYCGVTESDHNNFKVFESHKSYCAMIRQSYWQTILAKLTINKLQLREGQFLKTQAQVKAKQLRQQLQNSSNKAITSLNNLKLKIKSIKSDFGNSSHEDDSQQFLAKTRLSRLDIYADQILQYLKGSIKKVKIE